MIPFLLAALLTWTPHPSDGVEMHLAREAGVNRLDFDFHGHGGYAIARARVDRDLPANYQIAFQLRGEAPPENLELKLLDESGDNVWWLNRRDFVFPRQWTAVKTKRRQIAFAWGPRGGGELAHVTSIELVVTAGSGGKGTVWFGDPEIEPLPPTPTEAVHFDGPRLDLGQRRELGGLAVDWDGPPPHDLHVVLDGVAVTPLHAGRFVWLPDAEARNIEVPGGRSITVQPPAWAPGVNDFWSLVARDAPRGTYPRYLIGEQSYWTVVGAEGADEEALVGEDGAVEPFKGGFSIEPFLVVSGKRLTWADFTITHSLADGYLPIPTVTWKRDGVTLTITAAVSASSMLQLRYRVMGNAKLQLETRPFQVNPSTQFLNLQGGYAPLDARAAALDLSGSEVDIPLHRGAKRQPFAAIAAGWRAKLNRVAIDIPADPRVADTIRSNIAFMLIERDGAAFKPGSRSYDRAWIRDGALMASTLLRLGHTTEAKAFAEWYSKFQYADGKVPCCVDARGADPVPENDSHGELIYLVAEIWRYTHDEALVRRLWPHVAAAAKYIETLRAANHGAFEGLVTESISHEGYSAKPMHSYWDDFFALKGLEDAATLAAVAGTAAEQQTFAAAAQSMRHDLATSIRRSIDEHHIDYVPGSAELGDFDATSTAIGISPLNLTDVMPPRQLAQTFDRYLASLQKPRFDYTPYETRNIGALIRLGRGAEAAPLIDLYLGDRRPARWNGWAEAIRTNPRTPGFVGDMPHAWVGSDFVRSMLDAFAYEAADGTLVVAAGIPRAWARAGAHAGPLRTSRGPVDVRVRETGGRVVAEVQGAEGWKVVAPAGVRVRKIAGQ
jgi:hypothetical protein